MKRILHSFDGMTLSKDGYSPFEPLPYNGAFLRRYNFDWLDAHVLSSFNCVVNCGMEGVGGPAMRDYVSREDACLCVNGGHGGATTTEELIKRWTPWTEPPFVNVFVDEFVPPTYGFAQFILDAMAAVKGAIPFCGWNSSTPMDGFGKLFNAIGDRPWIGEFRFAPGNDAHSCQTQIDSELCGRMNTLDRLFPGVRERCIVMLDIADGYDTSTPSTVPNIDWHVWLDWQFHAVATRPEFAGIAGVLPYTFHHCKPETVLWTAALVRHYFVENKRTLLCPRPIEKVK